MTSSEDIAGFRRAQRLAYDCTTFVESSLEEGMTERDASDLLCKRLADAGVRHWFHVPFAWFGDHTALAHDGSAEAFAASDRVLERGMPVILDIAPIVESYVADIGYTFSFGENPQTSKMLDDLEVYRREILSAVRAGRSRQEIYRQVEARMKDQGYENRHRVYPMGVIGHRVTRIAPSAADEKVSGAFGESATAFFRDLLHASKEEPGASPFWNEHGGAIGESRVSPGVWAVEPHIGRGGLGAKWEEMLVVTENDAYWLDDDLPHVRRWAKRNGAA